MIAKVAKKGETAKLPILTIINLRSGLEFCIFAKELSDIGGVMSKSAPKECWRFVIPYWCLILIENAFTLRLVIGNEDGVTQGMICAGGGLMLLKTMR